MARNPRLVFAAFLFVHIYYFFFDSNGPSNFLQRHHDARNNQNEKSKEQNKKLEFVHIPKTAGSTIEQIGADAGLAWGACKFQGYYPQCLNLPDTVLRVEEKQHPCYNTEIASWHCPPTKFRSGMGFYNNSKTFAIVRNPYNRIVSEYYWRMKADKTDFKTANNADYFNQWISNALDFVLKYGYYFSGHCIPMHEYTHLEGEPVVDHILYMENLSTALPALMEAYGIHNVSVNHRNPRNEMAKLSVRNMTPASIHKVNYWAHLDFEYFGYDMILPD